MGSADEPEWPCESDDDGLYDGQGRYEEILAARDCYDVDEPLEEMPEEIFHSDDEEPNKDDDEEEAKTEPENEEEAESEGSAKIVHCPSDDSLTWP